AEGGIYHAGQRMADRQPQGLCAGHPDAGAIGPARPVPGERGPRDVGNALFRRGKPRKPDLEPADAAALVGAVCRIAERSILSHGGAGQEFKPRELRRARSHAIESRHAREMSFLSDLAHRPKLRSSATSMQTT